MTRTATPEIHLINRMELPAGSELRTLELYRILAPVANATIWSEGKPHPLLAKEAPIRPIRARLLQLPRRGTFVFVGAYYYVGRWVQFANPKRTILIYNEDDPESLWERLERLSDNHTRKVEIVYASRELRRRAALPGIVQDSPIDISRFKPANRASRHQTGDTSFVVGRVSRDQRLKHGETDPILYRHLAELGCRIRVAGGSCLEAELDRHPRVEVLPTLAPTDVPPFLHGLDCFLYRTSSRWFESFGRVLMEAMACGLPVICERESGAAEFIHHGVNGFLVRDDAETLDTVLALKRDPNLRSRIAKAARRIAEERNSDKARRELRAFFLDARAGRA
ncbi:MAG: glycosyltransferase family 4 protein [Casimicrobiaceae bacterium]